jgi:hypothetical protein
MAKKRDSKGQQERIADRAFQSGVIDPRAFEEEGTNFADMQGHYPSEGDIEAWEDDEETAPDIFAIASDEGRMQAGGGHTQRLDEDPSGQDHPAVRQR